MGTSPIYLLICGLSSRITEFVPYPQQLTMECPPVDITAALGGICTVVDPEAVHRELVPFGPAFQNISAPLHISDNGPPRHRGRPSLHCYVPFEGTPCLKRLFAFIFEQFGVTFRIFLKPGMVFFYGCFIKLRIHVWKLFGRIQLQIG